MEWSTIIITAAVCTYAVEFHIVISDSPVAIAQLIGDSHCSEWETYGQSELHLLSYYYILLSQVMLSTIFGDQVKTPGGTKRGESGCVKIDGK